jgi:hypothetical protein
MKVTIKDVDILKAIEPYQAAAYLQANGWHEWRQIPNKASVWMKKLDSGEEFQIVLPKNSDTPGYPVSMNMMLETLEVVAESSQIEILNEVLITPVTYPKKVQGMVIGINADETKGKVILMGVVMGKLEKIVTNLEESDYLVAMKAYQERSPVVCRGDLIEENNYFILENVRDFMLDETWKN